MTTRRRWFSRLVLALAVFASTRAFAAPDRRYALLVGANHGGPGDVALRYAVRDAERLADVLVSLGGFERRDVGVLRDPDANDVRAELARLNARIRAELDERPSVLFFFYSGHADALTLRLGGSALPWDELRDLASSSSAQARLVVVDACRSGHATRVKGTRPEPLVLTERALPPEGVAIISSAAAGESAQESDALRGSFFTHHLLAALRGVADRNIDGRVTLTEAYEYASDRTIASSAASLDGLQHPTYRIDLRGRADLVLTRPEERGRGAGELRLRDAGVYVVREGGPEGALALEASVGQPGLRRVKLPPGRYFVQRRATDALHEAAVDLEPDAPVDLRVVKMRTVSYGAFVRKGGSGASHAFVLGAGGGTPVLDDFSPSLGVGAVLSFERPSITWDVAVAVLRSRLERRDVLASSFGVARATIGARRNVDVGPLTFGVGVRVGAVSFLQTYEGMGVAPRRHGFGPALGAVFRAELGVARWLFIVAEIEAESRLLRLAGDGETPRVRALTQATALVGAGARF